MEKLPSECSFEELYNQWKDLIYKFSWKYIIPGWEHEDIEQELKIALLRAQETFDPDKHVLFKTYLYKVLDSKMKVLYRDTQGRKKHIPEKTLTRFSAFEGYEPYVLDNTDTIDVLQGLSPQAVKLGTLIITSPRKTRKSDWLLSGLTKEEVTTGLKDLREALSV